MMMMCFFLSVAVVASPFPICCTAVTAVTVPVDAVPVVAVLAVAIVAVR